MRKVSSTAQRRRKIVHDIEVSICLVKYGVPVLLINSVVNWFLDCCGVGMIL